MFKINKKQKIYLNMPARYNVYNALAASAAARELGVEWKYVKGALRKLRLIPGRYNTYKLKNFTVIIDYAHTPDGLSKLLTSARETIAKGRRLITVFGCGGDRDRGKRPQMGAISMAHSDFSIVTSDNPRSENPSEIMKEIKMGMKPSSCYVLIEDRVKAIEYAIKMARSGDVVIIAGKGAEEYQEIGGVFHKYCDKDVIGKYMSK